MNTSVRWLNTYLDPADITAESAEDLLTNVGFPIESHTDLPTGDVMLDVEVTSNRGDCFSHVGLAREIAAASGRQLRFPVIPPASSGDGVNDEIAIENRVHDVCSMFTARVIKGVRVGPSPDWLVESLEAVGQRSINNVVDVTNYVLFELGQPSHVFDLATLAPGTSGKPTLIIRYADKKEKLKLLDGGEVELRGDELVVADGKRAVSLAGIMGGLETEVSEQTTDVLLEAATWDPVTVRTAARRYNLRTDASHRFERIVDPRTIEPASRRLADLIIKVAGGELVDGVIADGAPLKDRSVLSLRPSRCSKLLGTEIRSDEAKRILHALDVGVEGDEPLSCTIPPHRPDLTREVDLIEEVVRIHGIDQLPLHERVSVPVPAPQPSEAAQQEIGHLLTAMGYFEAITFTFVSEAAAKPFLAGNLEMLEVGDERRGAEPVLRPSMIPSLLKSRHANQSGGVTADGGVRLYEVAPVFAATPQGEEVERRVISMIADVPVGKKAFDRKQAGIRQMRGVLDELAFRLAGRPLTINQVDVPMKAYEPGACGEVLLDGERIGVVGLLSSAVLKSYDLKEPVVACEIGLDPLMAHYPVGSTVHALPDFPGIARDVSLVVGEDVRWGAVESLVDGLSLDLFEAHEFVGNFRGDQIGAGKKSMTVRLRFRDPSRTLRHEEVDPQVERFVAAAKKDLGADVRV